MFLRRQTERERMSAWISTTITFVRWKIAPDSKVRTGRGLVRLVFTQQISSQRRKPHFFKHWIKGHLSFIRVESLTARPWSNPSADPHQRKTNDRWAATASTSNFITSSQLTYRSKWIPLLRLYSSKGGSTRITSNSHSSDDREKLFARISRRRYMGGELVFRMWSSFRRINSRSLGYSSNRLWRPARREFDWLRRRLRMIFTSVTNEVLWTLTDVDEMLTVIVVWCLRRWSIEKITVGWVSLLRRFHLLPIEISDHLVVSVKDRHSLSLNQIFALLHQSPLVMFE